MRVIILLATAASIGFLIPAAGADPFIQDIIPDSHKFHQRSNDFSQSLSEAADRMRADYHASSLDRARTHRAHDQSIQDDTQKTSQEAFEASQLYRRNSSGNQYANPASGNGGFVFSPYGIGGIGISGFGNNAAGTKSGGFDGSGINGFGIKGSGINGFGIGNNNIDKQSLRSDDNSLFKSNSNQFESELNNFQHAEGEKSKDLFGDDYFSH